MEATDQLGVGIPEFPKRQVLLRWLTEKGANMFTGVNYKKITDRGLIVITGEGKELAIEADTILVAIPSKPNKGLFQAFKNKGLEVYLIGDAREPRVIGDAIADGYQVGRSI